MQLQDTKEVRVTMYFFQTGTDEHGQKIELKADEARYYTKTVR